MDCNLFTSIDQQSPPDLLITPSDQRAPMASATLTVAANKYTCSLPLSSSSSSSAASSSRIQSILMSQPPKRSILPLTTSSSSSSSSSLGISETFSNLKKQGKVAFIPYITAGDPDLATTAQALKLLSSMGADVIELGLPYSDPVLDGPVIQASNKRALANKTTTQAVISMLEEVIPQISCPVVIFSYSNLVLGSKSKWFLSALQGGGVKGLIVPDLPFEESAALRKEAAKKDIDMILLTTPTTTVKKRKAIADASQGFMYLVSSVGVTGARHTVNAQVEHLLKEIKEETSKPVAVGFGISKPEHVKQISSWGADGVIVGSAIVKLLGEAKSSEEGLRHVESFVASLRAALPSGHNAPAFAEEHSSKVNVFQESRWLWQEQRVASSLPFLRECHLSVGSVHDASRSR